MKLKHGLHLAYCTNIHRGETWQQTLDSLQRYTLAVRKQVCPDQPYAIGLRLSHQAAQELSDPATLRRFQRWLDQHQCYIFTINGFPYGRFHGTRVKEQVYLPDWTSNDRVEYTNLLFDLLVQLLPQGIEGSISTVPASYKDFIESKEQVRVMRQNLWRSVEHIAQLSERTGKKLHLGLEPEPLCYLETSRETVDFFHALREDRPRDPRLDQHLGVNYDNCHLAVEFEEPAEVIDRFQKNGVKISKIHFSSALKVTPTAQARHFLQAFADSTYFHQVVARSPRGHLGRYSDLDVALAGEEALEAEEWRIHFHVPLHSPTSNELHNTNDHILGVMDALRDNPLLCSHLEMETYTWEVMPAELKNRDVVDQIVGEYQWTLRHLKDRGLA